MSRSVSFNRQVRAGAHRMRIHHLMRELRARRLTYTAIAGALEVFEGLHFTEAQVRGRLRWLGEPADLSRVRAQPRKKETA